MLTVMTGELLYVHLPFCKVRCTYCPFAIEIDDRLQERYISALISEIRKRCSGREFSSLYLGGGTPSRLRPELLALLFREFGLLQIDPHAEVTIEANPEDVSGEVVESWRALGVNRISIGVQSMHDSELVPLGRQHGQAGAAEALRIVRAAGLRMSADLMIGLPGQTPASFAESLAAIVDGGVTHLSMYILDLEEGTSLQRQVSSGRTVLPDDDYVAGMYRHAVDAAAAVGLQQYEISNFAHPGHESRHNLGYWNGTHYAGVGMSAHSFDGAERFGNSRDLMEYVELVERGAEASTFRERLTVQEKREERLFLQLRQKRGIGYSELTALCGQEGVEWIERGTRDGWLEAAGENVRFTVDGFLLSNEFISQLF